VCLQKASFANVPHSRIVLSCLSLFALKLHLCMCGVCCSVLQCLAVCYMCVANVPRRVLSCLLLFALRLHLCMCGVCCSVVYVCCSVLHVCCKCATTCSIMSFIIRSNISLMYVRGVLQCVEVCCTCVANVPRRVLSRLSLFASILHLCMCGVCCSVLQCVTRVLQKCHTYSIMSLIL